MASEEIKPCPFCGGKAVMLHMPVYLRKGSTEVQIDCGNEHCIAQVSTGVRSDEPSAIAAWNTRNIALVDATDAVVVPAGVWKLVTSQLQKIAAPVGHGCGCKPCHCHDESNFGIELEGRQERANEALAAIRSMGEKS